MVNAIEEGLSERKTDKEKADRDEREEMEDDGEERLGIDVIDEEDSEEEIDRKKKAVAALKLKIKEEEDAAEKSRRPIKVGTAKRTLTKKPK